MKRCKLLYLIVGIIICLMLCSCDTTSQVTQTTKATQATNNDEDTEKKLDSIAFPSKKDKDAKLKTDTDTLDVDTDTGSEIDTSEADTDTESLESVYSELMDGIYDLILSEDRETDQELAYQALNGILDAGYSKTPEETLEYVGYAFSDLNTDGMPELIIGGITEDRDGRFFGRDIYAVYTCVQDEIYCICSGWSRNNVGWMEENVFYLLGSGGAAYTMIGQYELMPNATEWSCIDLYFTDENGIYHNQTGIYDVEQAEVTDMTSDEFWELSDELYAKVLEFELTPFSIYH